LGIQKVRDWPSHVVPRFASAIFLDRDGTINVDTHYPFRVEDLQFLPGAISTLVVLAALPVHIIVVSNQAGIALGMYPREAMSAFNKQLRESIEKAGGRIDAFYYCPHRELKDLAPGEQPCACSKPAPGMLLEAAAEFHLDLAHSLFIGDKPSDVAAGLAAGCYTILLAESETHLVSRVDYVVKDLPSVLPIVHEVIDRPTAARR
jgi:D-glycero-D-manno-heptose 1,7-bisphosphate phosphatase